MSALSIDIIGYCGIVINLYSMSSKGEYKLRMISFIANMVFMIYGFLLAAAPVIAGSCIALILHGYRLSKIRKTA